ncbi:MAG: cytochrome c, partial [Bacteroidota bacterium]
KKINIMKKEALIIAVIATLLYSCSGEQEKKSTEGSTAVADLYKEKPSDPKGIGKFTDVPVDAKLNKEMAEAGLAIYDLKCSSCHKLTSEKLVGPGWEGVTLRRKPEWVMNFVTNVDEMLDKDANAKALLEVCLVKMPNQNLSDEDARHIYEYMRKNDGVKP